MSASAQNTKKKKNDDGHLQVRTIKCLKCAYNTNEVAKHDAKVCFGVASDMKKNDVARTDLKSDCFCFPLFPL